MAQLYNIILDEAMPQELADEALEKIENAFERRYQVARNVIIVLSDEDIQSVIDSAGIGIGPSEGPEDTAAGVVFSLNGKYGGYFKSDLWSWIKDSYE